MKKLPFFGKEKDILYEKLPNGLEIFMVPCKTVKTWRIELVAKLGADIDSFIPLNENDYIEIPHGSAHFLEHKLFDTEDGDASVIFEDLGLDTNAATSYYATTYFLEGKNKLKDYLDKFLSIFFTGYFDPEKVESEKGIIGEEIDMYKDEPEWTLYEEARHSLFHNALKYDIAGTKESISKINSELLKKIYDVFYQPSNVFLVISGRINPQEVINVIKNNTVINKRISNALVKYQMADEPTSVNKEYSISYDNIVVPKLCYYFKYCVDDFSFLEPEIFKIYLNIIFYVLFGDGSSFSEKIYENKISNFFYVDSIFYNNIYCIGITGESHFADIMKDEIDHELENINISEEDFEREIKVRKSIIIRELDDIRDISNSIIRSIIVRGKYIDEKELLDQLNYEDFLKVLKKINFDNKCFNLLMPKEKKN